MGIIHAKTDKAMNIVVKQLMVPFLISLTITRQEILNNFAQVEVNIDYPEYDDVKKPPPLKRRTKTT